MKIYILGLLLTISSGFISAGGNGVITVGPLSAGFCNYTNIQDAIDNEHEFIHIVKAVYSESVNITDSDISIVGGFLDCASAKASVFNPGAFSTIEPAIGPAVSISGNSEGSNFNVALVALELINGEPVGIIPSGGLTLYGDVDLALYQSRIANNTGVIGGGVYAQSPASLFMRDTMIEGNSAYDGGGIYCNGCVLTIDRGSGIYNNEATARVGLNQGNGGGLYASEEAEVYVYSGIKNITTQHLGFHQNEAYYQGGGIYLNNSQLSLYGNEFFGFGDDINPVNITYNSAYSGGGIFAEASEVYASAFDISNNQATLGGAGMSMEQDTSLNVYADNLFADGTCWNSNRLQCNRMMNNTVTGTIIGQGGGAIKGLLSELSVKNVWFEGNSAGGDAGRGAVIYHQSGGLIMQNIVMFQNGDESETDRNVIEVRESDFEFINGSVIDNSAETALMTVKDDSKNIFEISNSIIHNNNQVPVLNLEGGEDAFLAFNCMLVHEQVSFSGLGIVINVAEGNPEFFNRSAGDLNLYSESSLAIDRCQTEGSPIQAFDLNLHSRGVDVNGIGNDDNPFIFDMGAIEYQGDDELLDVIFKNSFDPLF